MNKSILYATIVAALCMISSMIYAQNSNDGKLPSAILVQLKSEKNKIVAMTKAKDYKNLALVKKDAFRIQKATINDFKDHITYCPVYYYMDTNAEKVIAGDFGGVLFTADSSPVLASAAGLQDKKYIIVFYGYPVTQSHRKKVVPDSIAKLPQTEAPYGKGLVINNSKMEQISYLYKFDYENYLFKKPKSRKYIAVSKVFDMEYFPTASVLDMKLHKNQNRITINSLINVTDVFFSE